MTLYELTEQMRDFELLIDEETGEVLNGGMLDVIECERNEKIENICLYLKNLRSESKAIAEEVKVLNSRKNGLERKIDWLKGYLQDNLHGEKFKTPRVSVSYRRTPVVVCDDPSKLDKQYQRVKVEADKTAIKEAINRGESVDGAHMEDSISMILK